MLNVLCIVLLFLLSLYLISMSAFILHEFISYKESKYQEKIDCLLEDNKKLMKDNTDLIERVMTMRVNNKGGC